MSKRLLCQKTIQKIMRIGLYQAFLSVAFATFAHAFEVSGQKVLEQKVTLQLTNADVERVLDKLETVTRIKFMYNPQIFGVERKANYKFQNELLSDVLNRVLSPYQVTYEVFQERIILKRQEPQSAQPEAQSTLRQEAPKRKITGKVLDEKGAGLPGVSVVVKETQRGTTTVADGTFALDVPEENSILVFSFVGYKRQEVTVGNQTNLSVSLEPEASTLGEVVVTALGIARDKKALAYAVTEVKGSEFTQARENNVANALTGKIAGVSATGMATGPGGSSRIIIRGNGSLNGNNQPLYVINGMPMDNSTPGGTAADGNGMNVDRGDGIGGINPDDIESISVLKGGPAAALYGARASNGVILITTKKGKGQKGVGVEVNSNTTFEDIAVIPNWQYEYGQGVDGKKPTTVTEAKSTGRLSYGARMDGQPTIQVDGQLHPYSPQRDNLKNFYRTGSNYINSVAFTGGNESVNFRLGLNNTQSNSIVPNSSFSRRIANLNLNAFLGKKLSIETVFQYNLEQATNRPKVGYADMNPHWATYLIANVVDIRSLSPGYDPVTGKEMEWNPVPAAPNPYFVVNKFKNDDTKNRFISQGSIRYDILDNLYIKGRVSQDFYSFQSEYVQPTNNAYQPLGTYEARKTMSSETNGMLTLNYNTTFFKDLTFAALLGANAQKAIFDQTIIAGNEFTVPYFYSYTNLAASTTTPTYLRSAINSVFGSMDFGYKNIAYLTVSGRQDWFSVLNPKSNSIFYPSVGGSFILSDAFRLPQAISFAKLRASWAQVGGATVNAYQIYQYYSMQQGGHNGRPVQGLSSSQVPNPDLKPLTSTTYEGGIEAKFLNNRLGIDLTLYNRKTTDDIVTTNIALSSGYTSALLNVGVLSNKGVELLLTGTPIKKADFSWDVSYNMAYNKSKIERLADGITGIDIGTGVGGGVVRNVLDRPYGTVWGYRKKTDANGNVVFNTASGYAVRGISKKLARVLLPSRWVSPTISATRISRSTS
ncbi:SusC/RagA family TonB-linked outer membrane protein [Spirosoma sp. KNUC1025]|uniref:SusC/RagA family TonB-linked outer membrane protein n=1 Tax=Spirosoma sp. KNUC1025 TaxID=2894082 RepID=UPI00386BE8D6|nr:SusC/RagA family TonB-linked outer membrane protein [Spirosoma sp. KNUC1025]